MDFTFKTIAEFNDYFKDEKACYDFLEGQRWSEGPVCPHCGSAKKPYTVKPRGKFLDIPSYRCSEAGCKLPFTVRTGSIFEGSKVELCKWLQAAYELSISKKGISSVELGERIGVSQKTAWFINHRLRTMLINTAPELLKGEVEIDETYVGGKEGNKHRSKRQKGTGMNTKSPMVGFIERDEKKVVLKVIEVGKANGKTIKPLVRDMVAPESDLFTDGFGAYSGLAKEYKSHNVVRHDLGEYVKGNIHTNTIEGFWSLLKRGIIGTFHSVSHQHLQRYCDEFSYRYNNKDEGSAARFNDSIKKFTNARLTYRVLTQREVE